MRKVYKLEKQLSGEAVKSIRKRLDISEQKLADALGLNRNTIQASCAGKFLPPAEVVGFLVDEIRLIGAESDLIVRETISGVMAGEITEPAILYIYDNDESYLSQAPKSAARLGGSSRIHQTAVFCAFVQLVLDGIVVKIV